MRVVETERLVLRRLTAEDAEFILELVNDPDWLRFIGDRGVRTLDDARDYIQQGPVAMYSRCGFGLFLVEQRKDRVPVGICGLLQRDWLGDVDVGFAMAPRHRGRGYALEAAAATIAYASNALQLPRVVAIVSPHNEPSIRLLEKLGLGFERMAQPPNELAEVCVFAPRSEHGAPASPALPRAVRTIRT